MKKKKKMKYLLSFCLFPLLTLETQATELPFHVAKAYGEVLENVVKTYGAIEYTTLKDSTGSSSGMDGFYIDYEDKQGNSGTSDSIRGLYYAELVDFGNDGVPELMVSYVDIDASYQEEVRQNIVMEIWEYDKDHVKQIFREEIGLALVGWTNYVPMNTYSIETHENGQKYLLFYSYNTPRYHEFMSYRFYGYENGTFQSTLFLDEFISHIGNSLDYGYTLDKNNESIYYISGFIDHEVYDTPNDVDQLFSEYENLLEQGQQFINQGVAPFGISHERNGNHNGFSTPFFTTSDRRVELSPNLNLLDTLSNYSFSFPYTESWNQEEITKRFQEFVEEQEIIAAYTLTDDLYLLISEDNGSVKSQLLYDCITNGKEDVSLLYSCEGIAEAYVIEQYFVQFANNSNIIMDYNPLSTFSKVEDFSGHLGKILRNIAGSEVNQYGKQEIIQYISLCLAQMGTVTSSSTENQFLVLGEMLQNAVSRMNYQEQLFQTLLNSLDISLNTTANKKLQLILQNYDPAKPMQITMDKSILSHINPDISLVILISGTNYQFEFTYENLEKLLEHQDKFTFVLESMGASQHKLTFFDSTGLEISRIPTNIAVTLPSTSQLDTVFMNYHGNVDNWGGQFDEMQKTIRFFTSYTGEYEISPQSLTISDLDSLEKSQRNAIEFMVSKGYFLLEDQSFYPDSLLSRYEFAKALVGIFFALDRSLSTNFKDVPENSDFYPYVASAESENLVAGFSEEEFGGDIFITEEQVLAVVARTLSEMKGVPYLNDLESLENLSGSEFTSDWAKSAVALCYDNGIIYVGEEINPQSQISRGQSAEYLYRLFMLLYDVNPVTITVSEQTLEQEENQSIPLILGIALGWTGVLGTMTLGGIQLKKSKNNKNQEAV